MSRVKIGGADVFAAAQAAQKIECAYPLQSAKFAAAQAAQKV